MISRFTMFHSSLIIYSYCSIVRVKRETGKKEVNLWYFTVMKVYLSSDHHCSGCRSVVTSIFYMDILTVIGVQGVTADV